MVRFLLVVDPTILGRIAFNTGLFVVELCSVFYAVVL